MSMRKERVRDALGLGTQLREESRLGTGKLIGSRGSTTELGSSESKLSSSLEAFKALVDSFDWTFNYSDDRGVWKRGYVRRDAILNLCRSLDESEKLIAKLYHDSKAPKGFEIL